MDHPRSRGVYAFLPCVAFGASGSSPLARGLRRYSARVPGTRGIIPARAGFTTSSTRRGRTAADHPRSRGVYGVRVNLGIEVVGSSPLARGLPRRAELRVTLDGIIPARAGFTGYTSCDECRRQDHPRSRGVYDGGQGDGSSNLGSSPLARGLQPPLPGAAGRPRIIPARAGFTVEGVGGFPYGGDHPRSRGVYSPSTRSATTPVGSSPLARGLHGAHGAEELRSGIIPARAGFTLMICAFWSPRKDHPRSRGVYAAAHASTPIFAGSSPLARGLREQRLSAVNTEGIIPARAGFTSGPYWRRGTFRDHPRSRGVYPPAAFSDTAGGGSSPLARGLRSGLVRRMCRARIIPARAGFTR